MASLCIMAGVATLRSTWDDTLAQLLSEAVKLAAHRSRFLVSSKITLCYGLVALCLFAQSITTLPGYASPT